MTYQETILVFGLEWFKLLFVENEGMAFGLKLGGDYGKLALSVFRIVAVGFMIYYIRLLIKQGAHNGLIASISLILAGALGNILDSAFYGLIFSESYHHEVATMFPEEGGYAGFLYGKVVDMLHFPLYEGNLFGLFGDKTFRFFAPVFNIADSSITVGVFIIILFQRMFFKNEDVQDNNQSQHDDDDNDAKDFSENDIDDTETESPAEQKAEDPDQSDHNAEDDDNR